MKTLLFTRLKRLEKATGADNPLSLLSDEELEARIEAGKARIEACVGISLASYAEALRVTLQAGQAVPGDLRELEARAFTHAFYLVSTT
jgi:hypothetical protein